MDTYSVGILIVIFIINILQLERPVTMRQFLAALIGYIFLVISAKSILVMWIVFLFYRQGINIFLKARYGARYKGLVCGVDALHLIDKKNTITCVAWVKNVGKKAPEEVVQKLRNAIWRASELPKFQLSMHSFGGYWYTLQEKMHIDNYMKYFPKLNKPLLEAKEVLKLVNDCYNAKSKELWLPWEMYVGTEPVNWKNDGFEYYPVYCNIHHSVTDGVSLMKIVLGTFAYELENREVTLEKKKKKSKNLGVPDVLRLFCSGLWGALTLPASVFTTFALNTRYANFLPIISSSNKKLLTWGNDSGGYFSKVVAIKNAVSASFPEVLCSAYASSMADFIQKNNPNPPEFVTTIVALLPAATELRNLEPKDIDLKSLKASNAFSIVIMKMSAKERSLKKLLRLIRKEGDTIKRLSSYQINYVLLNYFTSYLPVIFNWVIIKLFCSGSAISIVPGAKKIVFDKGALEGSDCITWVPHLNQFGVTMIVISYAEHLQVGLSVDEALIPEEAKAKELIDGMFKYLDIFAKEVGVSAG